MNCGQALNRAKGSAVVLRDDPEGTRAAQRGREIGDHSMEALRQAPSDLIDRGNM